MRMRRRRRRRRSTEEAAAAATARWCGVDGCVATVVVMATVGVAVLGVLPKHLVREFGL
jgi:hypothetical protein